MEHVGKYPENVQLCEVGPRDGFQFEEKPIPTDFKLEIIRGLADAGVPRIQATSFVHPRWVPQMADAEEIMASLDAVPGVVYSALALNAKGVERAIEAGVGCLDISIATNEQHGRHNANMTVAQGIERAGEMVALAREAGIDAQLGLQTVFGYQQPGDTPLDLVVDILEQFADAGLESFSIADSTGLANPKMIAQYLKRIMVAAGETPLVLHLHDTRGLGLANVTAALAAGVRRFDTSLGGLGGCPFIPGATGNIATEDAAYLMSGLGIRTGIDLNAVAMLSRRLEAFLERGLSGKMYRLAGQDATASGV